MAQAQKKSSNKQKTPPKAPIEKLQDEMLRDVDESLRQEQLQKLWDRYGSMTITLIASIILLTAIISAWNSWTHSKNEKYTSALIEAIDSGRPAESLETYISEHKGAHQVIASFKLAGIYRQSEELEKASALYKEISENTKITKLYRDLGTLLYATTSGDTIEKGKLKKLFNDEKSPWRAHAGLEWALHLAAENDYNQALEVLKTIQSLDTTPTGIRQKSEALTTLYKLKGDQSQ